MSSVERILVLKDGKQLALGDLEHITKQGFNVAEVMRADKEEKMTAKESDKIADTP